MARYNVLYFCKACSHIHPMGVSLSLEDGPAMTTKHVGEAYADKTLPLNVIMLVGASVKCPETGKSFVLDDTNAIYLAPVLPASSSGSKRLRGHRRRFYQRS
jgi:hypothetical protein